MLLRGVPAQVRVTALFSHIRRDKLGLRPVPFQEKNIYQKDCFTDEIVVALEVENGIVIITGCSHPGIMNIIYTIQKRSQKKICGVVGGTHLVEADESRLKKTIADLKEMDIDFIAVSHCTGDDNLEIIKNEFGKKFIFNCTGNIIRF